MGRDRPLERNTAPREHPWERSRRSAFARWEADVHRVPYGHPVPDIIGFAWTIEPPLGWSDIADSRRLFALSALPNGSGPAYLAAIPVRSLHPSDGSLLRLRRPVKRALPSSSPPYGELVLEASHGIESVTWEELLEGNSSRIARSVVPQLSELWRLPPDATETLLLPLMGSLPWHGRPPGLELHLEVEGWSLARHRSFLSNVVDLAPEWVRRARAPSYGDLELPSGARIRRKSAASSRPYAIQLRPISSPPARRPADRESSLSVFTFGSALHSEFEALVAAGHSLLLLSAGESARIRFADGQPPDSLKSAVWGLHWWMPEPPEAPQWHQWFRAEDERLRRALDGLPGATSKLLVGIRGPIVERREFRDQILQTAYARARLRGASEVEEVDLARTVDALVQAADRASQWALVGRGPLTRSTDRTEGSRTARLRRALEELVRGGKDGLSLAEALRALRGKGLFATEWDVEGQLERLRIRGLLFQDRSGRYRLA